MLRPSPYRTLIAVSVVALLAGIYEFFLAGPAQPDAVDIYADAKHNYPDAISRLYPGTPEAEYLQGRRLEAAAGHRFDREELRSHPEQLTKVLEASRAELQEAARHYKRAIDLGLKSDENLYYFYALALIRLQADPREIDRAIAAWRKNFPFSDRVDLQKRRLTFEEQLRQLTAGRELRPDTTTKPLLPQIQAALDVQPHWEPHAGYVGSQACRECHPGQFDTYLETAHSRALAKVEPHDEPPAATFEHRPSGRRYSIQHSAEELLLSESLPLRDGSELPLTTLPARYRVGSGSFARTYLCELGGGFFVESPVTWYESAKKWDMTPGFDRPGQRSFTRQVLENCLWCHSGQTQTARESDYRLQIVELAIGCERCHGPGAQHVEHQQAQRTSGADATVVNPRRLSRQQSEALCQQCHLQGDIHIGGRNARATDFRPGQILEQFSTVYRLATGDTGMTVVGHVEQLHASRCYQQSETLTCITCHDPHARVSASDRVAHSRTICLSCHADQGCKLELTQRTEQANNDCVHCHMPQAATEVPHVAFTHHRIGLHPVSSTPPAAEPSLVALSDLSVLPEADRERSLMLARLQMFLQLGPAFQQSKAGRDLARELEIWLNRPTEQQGPDIEREFAGTLFRFVTGDLSHALPAAERLLQQPGLRSEEEAALREQLAQVKYQRNQFAAAAKHFSRLAQLRAQGQDWYLWGLCEIRNGRYEMAVQALQRGHALEPSRPELCEALAEACEARQDASGAAFWRQKRAQLSKNAISP